MDSPGYKTLGSYTITAAGNYGHATGAELTGLEDMERLTLLLSFAYGSGGTSGVVYLQTSLDQANEGGVAGGTWIDIAAMSFTTSSKSRVYNFSARTPVTAFAPADGTLTSDIAATYPLSEVREATEHAVRPGKGGKVILKTGDR